jgi:ADP-heptose:LPS heptosyltransferase
MPEKIEQQSAATEHERGRAHFARREITEAYAAFRRSLELGHDPFAALGERWSCAMLLGDYAAAWAESDRLLRHVSLSEFNAGRALHEQLVWDGRPLEGKEVLVRCHHGLGDTIQFLRFLPALRKKAARVTVMAQAPLLSFVAPLVDEALPLGPEGPGHEAGIEIMELSQALRLGPADVPPPPYLTADPSAADRWRRKLGENEGLNVGLAWNVKGFKPERSLSAASLCGLAGLPGVNFYCLQKFAPPAEHELLQKELRFRNPGGAPDEISETAALVANLDLVVSVDTMVAHLAGALGRPVWTLLHPDSDWRWMTGREDTPWYPSMRLLRQGGETNEISLVARVRSGLARLAARAP